MAFSRTHATAADGTFSAAGTTAWEEAHALSGADVGGIPYCPTATTEVTSANLTYTETSGPRLKVGTSGTSVGLIIGYSGSSGGGAVWNSNLTPSLSNYALYIDGTTSYLNGSSGCRLAANGVVKVTQDATAGLGPSITAGTATTDVNALSATQTWNAAGVAFTGWKFTITDTASAAGSLAMQILGGAAGTTSLLSLDKTGQLTTTANVRGGTGTTGSGFIGGGGFGITGRVVLNSSADGQLTMLDWAGTSFGRINFGGTTSSFPAIKRSSAELQARLADDSAFTGVASSYISQADANGQVLKVQSLTELTTIAAAATTDTTINIPANAIVLGVSVRVTTVIPTAATFTVTGATSGTAFQTGASVSTAATTTDAGTKNCPFLNATAQAIRITPNAQPADNTGRVRVTIHYLAITPPTS